MADVRPFRGLRFDSALVGDLGQVLCPPYDVMNANDERRYRDRHRYNAVRLELSTSSAVSSDQGRYAEAAATLRSWRDQGVLRRDESPTFYLHEVGFAQGGRQMVRRELIAAVRLEPWDARAVLPHERTYARPKADRLRLLEATGTNISPILSFFRRGGGPDAVGAAWAAVAERPPSAEGTDADGVGHRVWTVHDPAVSEAIGRFFEDRPLFIADGHHRYETALHYRQEVGAAPNQPASFVMMHLIAADDPGLVILPIHRLLRGLDGLDLAGFETSLRDFRVERFSVSPDASAEQLEGYVAELAARGHAGPALGIYGRDRVFRIVTPSGTGVPASVPQDRDPSWQSLDVVLAEAAVIHPLLAERGLAAENAIDYTRDAREAFAAVEGGERQIAVLLNPTRVEQVAAVALANERMPEKSTYFYPKAPTGLVLRPLEGPDVA